MTVGRESRLAIGSAVYARAFGAEMVLLEFGRGEYFGLDEVGAAVWRGLEAGLTLGAIAEEVVGRFDVDSEQALRDIVGLVTELLKNDLVRAV